MNIKLMGTFIAELRKENGLSQEELAERLGTSGKTISRWETGTYMPPVDILESLGKLFGVSINELVAGHRMTEEEYRENAEKNLRTALEESVFSLSAAAEKYLKLRLFFFIFLVVALGTLCAVLAFFFPDWYIPISIGLIAFFIGEKIIERSILSSYKNKI